MSNQTEIKTTEKGIGLCLSGGGFRATLFHLGVLWRLNELGYLPKINRFSSVSGGSIMSAWLGLAWNKLKFDQNGVAGNFVDVVVKPIREFGTKNLDIWIVLSGILNPFKSIGDVLINSYRKHLFGNATLQDLPETPRFMIVASNVQSGVLWRFSKPYMWDYRVGKVEEPKTELAVAVAASSAFPPFLSPVKIKLNNSDFVAGTGKDLQEKPYTTNVVLVDGGVYDNLGLEPIIKRYETILVSDAGGKMLPDPKPKLFWGLQAFRVLSMIDNQVRALRKRDIINLYKLRRELLNSGVHEDNEAFKHATRKGAYWSTFSDIADYHLVDALECPIKKTTLLAKLPTRLWSFSDTHQKELVNWGYAVCDAAMRKFVILKSPIKPNFPYKGGVG